MGGFMMSKTKLSMVTVFVLLFPAFLSATIQLPQNYKYKINFGGIK